MAVVKFFVNDVKRQLHKAEISREGSRAIDQAKIQVPAETPIESTDTLTYVQDMVELCTNRLLFNFCQHVKDESGYKHHPIGHADFPTACSFWDFQNTTCDTGKDQNTTTEVCGCSVFIAGKVRDTGAIDRAISFACCRHLTVSNANCDYSFRKDTKWTLATWVFPTASCSCPTLMAKRVGLVACNTGYSLNLGGMCNVAFLQLSDGTCNYSVSSSACTITDCMWNHIAVTFGGQNNLMCAKLYINGELSNTGACCTITSTITNCCCFSIGALSGGAFPFTGRMDGTYTFTKELDACGVKSLYYAGALDYICGLWDGKAVEFDGETAHTTIQDKAPADPRPSNLKLQLKFECDITDSSDTNCCITMGAGCATFVDSIVDDKQFCFNGGCCGRFVLVECNTNFNFTACTPFSVAMWAKGSSCNNEPLVSKLTACPAFTGWELLNLMCGKLRFQLIAHNLGCCCKTNLQRDTTTAINDGDYHHIVATYDGLNTICSMNVIIDGVDDPLVGIGCCSCCDVVCGSILNCESVAVGARPTGGMCRYTGTLDCVRVWDKKLTIKEAKGLHDSTFGAGFRGQYEVVTWVKAPCSAMCNRTIFHKSGGACIGVELSINGTVGGGQGFTGSGFTPSGFTDGSGATACAVNWRHNTTLLTSTTDITDCCWHQIRVKRDACNLVSLFVDNVLEDCGTDATCPICEIDAEFGRDFAMCEQFDGAISSFRMYGCNLSTTDTCNLFTIRNPRSNVKFGGEVTKVEKRIGHKRIITQSLGKQLGEVEVRAVQFCMRTPEYILRTLIKDNTILDTHFHGIESGIILCSYQADGKLIDISNDLSQLTGKVYRTDGLGQFHLHDASFTLTTASFNHQVNMTNIECGKCDSEVVNCLLIIGENKRFTTSCTFCGDGTTDTFLLAQQPVTARVFSPAACCTELTPEEDYEVQTATKTLKFDACAIPLMCTTALIEYEFEQPLNIRGKDEASIADIGIKAKRLVLPWITTRQDGVRFINAYIQNFKEVKFRTSATIPGLSNGVGENDVVSFTNNVKGVDGTFIIKSIKWLYPQAVTTMELGEFNFQMLEFAKQITEKIHDLESAVVRVKDLRDFEAPQETLALIDTSQILTIASQGLQFTEVLALGDAQSVTEQFDAVYDGCCTTYDGNDAYV